jgi:hypothetical protein
VGAVTAQPGTTLKEGVVTYALYQLLSAVEVVFLDHADDDPPDPNIHELVVAFRQWAKDGGIAVITAPDTEGVGHP